MRFLTWSVRLALFLLLLGFALKNDQTVVLRYFFGFEWQTSLVVALLCFFTVGVVIGLLAMLGSLLRQRRELATVRRELQPNRGPSEQDEMTQPQTTPPERLS